MEGVNNMVYTVKMSSKDTIQIQILEIFLNYINGSKPIKSKRNSYWDFLARMIL